MNRFIKLGTAALLSCFAVAMAGDAEARGNLKVATTIHATTLTTMDAPWDTVISVTASTLDTLSARGYCSRIFIAGVSVDSLKAQAVGSQYPLSVNSTTLGSGFKQVNYKLTKFPLSRTDWSAGIRYDSGPNQLLRGVIIDGLQTGDVYIRFEP